MATISQRVPVRPVTRPRLRPAAPLVSTVVINYCQWRNVDRLTRQLLDSDAINSGHADIVVVDNDSPPSPTISRLRRSTGVAVRKLDRNTGFARAANEGLRQSRGEWALLLNPDTAVPDGFLDQLDALCRSLEHESPRIGVIGLALAHEDGSIQASCGAPPTLSRTIRGLMVPRQVRKCRPVLGDNRTPVPWVTGCGMLIRRECWADLGGLDESFFLYYEDADFCRRAWTAGWSVWYEPSIQITHFKPLHTRPVPPELRLMTRHALLTYAAKYWKNWEAKALAGIVWLEGLARQTRSLFGSRVAREVNGDLRRLASEWFTGKLVDARSRVRRVSKLLANCAGREDGPSMQMESPEPVLRAAA